MRKRSAVRIVVFAALAMGFAVAQLSYAQTDATASNPSDLAARIDALQKQLEDLKSQMQAQKTQTIAEAPVPEPLQAAAATPTTPAAPAAPTLAGLLGPTTLSGFVDVYYGYNANQPANRLTTFRNFDYNSGAFGLNMIELVADKSPDAAASRVGYHVALGFGNAMNIINSTEAGQFPTESNYDQYLKEGYLEYLAPVGKGLQINVGKFVTPAGAEVIESKDNWNYSRGLLFALAIPYFHFGASAKYTFNPKFAVTGYVVNGWNNSVDNNTGKTAGFSAAWTPNAKFSIIENYLGGPEQLNDNGDFRHLSDTVITYNPTAKLSLMANYDYGHDHFVTSTVAGVPPFTTGPRAVWSGLAGYIKYAPNDKYYLAVRGEYFDDNQGFETAVPGGLELSEYTITFQRLLAGKLISRLEFRRDMSDTAVFLKGSSVGVKTQNTATIGLVYAFSSADAK
jgi:outer membrane murein-binding lipoprotein Lpp